MTADLPTRAAAAVAAGSTIPGHGPRMNAFAAVRASYKADGLNLPPFADIIDAVDEAMSKPTPAPAEQVESTPSEASYYKDGTDLDFVLSEIDGIDPIDVETWDATEEQWAIHKTLNRLRAEIRRRQAVQAGMPMSAKFCGVGDAYGQACGPELGLPSCAYHAAAARNTAGN